MLSAWEAPSMDEDANTDGVVGVRTSEPAAHQSSTCCSLRRRKSSSCPLQHDVMQIHVKVPLDHLRRHCRLSPTLLLQTLIGSKVRLSLPQAPGSNRIHNLHHPSIISTQFCFVNVILLYVFFHSHSTSVDLHLVEFSLFYCCAYCTTIDFK